MAPSPLPAEAIPPSSACGRDRCGASATDFVAPEPGVPPLPPAGEGVVDIAARHDLQRPHGGSWVGGTSDVEKTLNRHGATHKPRRMTTRAEPGPTVVGPRS
jgi:hypothetical protein